MISKLYTVVISGGIIFFLCSSSLLAQQMGFPQHKDFDKCIKPGFSTSAMDSSVSKYYKTWKNNFLGTAKSTPGGYYVKAQGTSSANTITVSEAHGYGMIIMALMAGTDPLAEPNARDYFDGMVKFFRAHPCETDNDLMSWEIDTNSSGQEVFKKASTATDGDLDMAYALVLAHYQWGSAGAINYLDEAKKVIAAIKRRDMNLTNKRVMLGDFGEWTNPSHPYYAASRPSDWMYDHFRVFADITQDSFWKQVADTAYSIYKQFIPNNSAATGLISDFLKGTPPVPMKYGSDESTLTYAYNACRVPLRLAVDYAHFGTTQAKDICNKMLDWLIDKTGNWPSKAMDGYQLDGTATGTYPSSAFVGPFTAACVVDKSATNKDYATFITRGWKRIAEITEGYYEDSITLLSMLLMSGNWWRPGMSNAIKKQGNAPANARIVIQTSGPARSLCVKYSLAKSGKVFAGIYDLKGKWVLTLVNGIQTPGAYSIPVRAAALSSGMYIVKFTNEKITESVAVSIVE
jgi:endo-1,4-beta-D-glucanase Y